jgi:hypothetical protein
VSCVSCVVSRQNLSVVDFEGAFQLFRAVLTVRPDDVLIIFLCAEICFSWARTLGVRSAMTPHNAALTSQLIHTTCVSCVCRVCRVSCGVMAPSKDSKDGTSPPYKKAIKYYQKVVDIARKTNKTASPSTEERRQPHTQSDVSVRPCVWWCVWWCVDAHAGYCRVSDHGCRS